MTTTTLMIITLNNSNNNDVVQDSEWERESETVKDDGNWEIHWNKKKERHTHIRMVNKINHACI